MEYQGIVQNAVEIHGLSSLVLKFFNEGIEKRLKEKGLGIKSFHIGIIRMLYMEPLTISDLSNRLGMDPSSLVRMIDSLEKKGLAKRGTDPEDRRRNPIHLTEQGRNLIEEVPVVADEDPMFKALNSLDPEEIRQLRDLLFKLIFNIPEGKMILDIARQWQEEEN